MILEGIVKYPTGHRKKHSTAVWALGGWGHFKEIHGLSSQTSSSFRARGHRGFGKVWNEKVSVVKMKQM